MTLDEMSTDMLIETILSLRREYMRQTFRPLDGPPPMVRPDAPEPYLEELRRRPLSYGQIVKLR